LASAKMVLSSASEIAAWLDRLGLGQYAKVFEKNAVDMEVLPELTEGDLEKLNIPLGHRKRILKAIGKLSSGSSEPPRSEGEKRPLSGVLPEERRKVLSPDANADGNALATTETAIESVPPEEAERRQLSVMFCDLVGSTALSARLDPEDLRRVMRAYQDCIADVIHPFNGMIARYQGDGVLAYFGYPEAHEDDAAQATRAGLALIDAVTNLQTDIGSQLQIRVGIATGTVIVGDLLGEGASREQAVVGDTPNLAARLQRLAEPGTVLICPSTRRLTGGHFDYRDLGRINLEGWAEPTAAWQVLGSSGVQSRFEAMHKTKLPPLFGREEEIELLLRRWRHVTQEEGRVVVLTGEPGIGKSHIALALEERLQSEPHITLHYFCSAHHTNSALFPFIGQLERAAGFERSDSPTQKLSKLDLLVAHSTADPEQAAILGHLLGLPASDRYGLQELSPQKRKEKTLAALLAQLGGLARRQPVYIIFEDVHWIDPTSLELLAATVERVPKLRVLLLATARPEFTPPWASDPHMTTIALTRLGRRDGAALVGRVTGGKALPKEVMDEILARTDGVPLFIEELTKTVLESGLLQERDGHYLLERQLPSLAIPTTLHASLMARIDRLAPVREVAQIGAVAGRDFHYELLKSVSGFSKERLEEALGQLVQSELVFRRGEIPHAVYTFKHALVRDAAYAGLLKSRRGHLHAAIANAIEQQFPEIAQTQPETLAHHLTEAGLFEKAIGYWLQAGKNAALRSANLEAIAHLERGIEITGRLPAGAGKDRSELDLQLVLGPCLIATHGPAASKAVATFARARELCERLGDPPECLQVMFWLATVNVVRGELPRALEAIADLPSAAEARGNQPALINGIRGQGMILMFMGRLTEAREALERAVEVFSASQETDRMAARAAGQDAGVATLVLMAWAFWILGEVDEAVSRMAAALERADAIQHAHTHAYAWYYASVLHALRGEPAVAQGYAERCLSISEQHGFRQWLGLSRAIRGICAAALDASGGQLDEVKAALEEYQRAGYQVGITAQFVLLCHDLLLRNDPVAALETIDHGLAIVSRNDERFFEAELYRLKAHALLMRGAPDAEAEALLDQALRTARSQRARSLELRAATDLAKVWVNRGKRAEARDVLGSIYGRFTEGFDTQDLRVAEAVLAQLQSS
jgi:class 3 adenylate cyclase/tetratricopeptide (TPR) repeat protein